MIVVDVISHDGHRRERWPCKTMAEAIRIATARRAEYDHDRAYRGSIYDPAVFVVIADSVHPYTIAS